MEESRNKIPEGWKLKKISDIGYSYGGLTGKSKENFGVGSSKYISFLNVLNNPIINTKILEQVDVKVGEKQNEVRKGDLFFNTSSETPEEVGTCSVLLEELSNTYLNSFCFGFRLTDDNISGLYLAYYFRSKYGRELMITLAQGATRYNLSKNNFEKSYIMVPDTIFEQDKIAKNLSNIDTLISQLEVLIEKKKAIKQGAMQELLTGKRRLKGFKEPWVEKRIKEIGALTGAGVDKLSKPTEMPVRLLNYLDVFHRDHIYDVDLKMKVTASAEKKHNCNVLQGDVFFTPSSEMPFDIALSAVAMEDMNSVCYSYHIYRLRFNIDIDLYYKAYMFKTPEFYNQANQICEGSGKRYVISLTKFREMFVKYPSTKEEQAAIASIITTMDNEIAVLENKHSKYIAIKQGMMQQLLTGKIRII